MKKRGKVLRDPRTGPGLLMIEGRQYWFCLEGVWKSEVPPKPGLAVDVKLDHAGQVLAITAVSESQLAEEQAERSVDTVKATGAKILRKIAAKCGMPHKRTLSRNHLHYSALLSLLWLDGIAARPSKLHPP